jgi:serine/threonine protein phosphatase PrpC
MEGVQIASTSAMGGRNKNEDYINIDALPDFEKLSTVIQKLVLQSWVNEIQKTLRENNDHANSGTTACVGITWIDDTGVLHNLTGNLGDSHAHAYILKKSQDEKPHALIEPATKLSVDHKPADDSEKARIINEGGSVIFGRINYSLNLSRALGDLELSPLVSDELTFEELTHTFEPNEKVIFFYACDGTDSAMKKDAFQAELLKNNSIGETTGNILKLSLNTDARDNTSFTILSFEQTNKATTPIFSAIYDGHGGEYTAKLVSEQGLEILKNKIKFALTPTGAKQLIKEDIERKVTNQLRLLKKAHLKQALKAVSQLSPDGVKEYSSHLEHTIQIECKGANTEKVIEIINKHALKHSKTYMGIELTFNWNETLPPSLIDCVAEIAKVIHNKEVSDLEKEKARQALEFNPLPTFNQEKKRNLENRGMSFWKKFNIVMKAVKKPKTMNVKMKSSV